MNILNKVVLTTALLSSLTFGTGCISQRNHSSYFIEYQEKISRSSPSTVPLRSSQRLNARSLICDAYIQNTFLHRAYPSDMNEKIMNLGTNRFYSYEFTFKPRGISSTKKEISFEWKEIKDVSLIEEAARNFFGELSRSLTGENFGIPKDTRYKPLVIHTYELTD